MQKEQERLMRAILEMNSSEAATSKRTEREKQKLMDKMSKQEDFRVKNEKARDKRLKEFKLDLQRAGTHVVVAGLDEVGDEPVTQSSPRGAAGAAMFASQAGGGGAAVAGDSLAEVSDVDEGEPILAMPERGARHDLTFFEEHRFEDVVARSALLPQGRLVGQGFRPGDHIAPPPPANTPSFVPSPARRRVVPPRGELLAPPAVVYDTDLDTFKYMSAEDAREMRAAEERHAAALADAVARGAAAASPSASPPRGALRVSPSASSPSPQLLGVDGMMSQGGSAHHDYEQQRLADEHSQLGLPPLPEIRRPVLHTGRLEFAPLSMMNRTVRASTDSRLEGSRWNNANPADMTKL